MARRALTAARRSVVATLWIMLAIGIPIAISFAIYGTISQPPGKAIALHDWIGQTEANPALANQGKDLLEIDDLVTLRNGVRVMEFRRGCRDLDSSLTDLPSPPHLGTVPGAWMQLAESVVTLSTNCRRLVASPSSPSAAALKRVIARDLLATRIDANEFSTSIEAVLPQDYILLGWSDSRLLSEFGV
jgi:hypothetical protein